MSGGIEPTPKPATSGKAIASLVLGILSLGCSILTAIPAVILGVISLNDIRRNPNRVAGRGLAIGGIVAGSAGTFMNFLILILIGLLLPAVMVARESARRAHSVEKIRQIGVAMHRYQANYSTFPRANGLPGQIPTSWRARLLPYMENDAVLGQYNFKEPWDGPTNRIIAARQIPVYHDPGNRDSTSNKTRYLGLTGPGTAFEPGKTLHPGHFGDGLTNTILFVEADAERAVPWAEPKDLSYDSARPLEGIGNHGTGQFLAAFADGSVRSLPGNIDPEVFRALVSRNGKEPIPEGLFKARK